MTLVCWSCRAAGVGAGVALCPACGVVQPPGQATPFERLDVPRAFAAALAADDDKALERAWLTKSRAVHPDRFARKSDAERRYAVEQTAALNDAYRAIRDPFDRASWLVKDAGVDLAKLDQRMLHAMMEARELAEESAHDKAAVVDEARAKFASLMATLPAALAHLDDVAALKRAAVTLAEMKTWARLVDDLGGGKLIATMDGR